MDELIFFRGVAPHGIPHLWPREMTSCPVSSRTSMLFEKASHKKKTLWLVQIVFFFIGKRFSWLWKREVVFHIYIFSPSINFPIHPWVSPWVLDGKCPGVSPSEFSSLAGCRGANASIPSPAPWCRPSWWRCWGSEKMEAFYKGKMPCRNGWWWFGGSPMTWENHHMGEKWQ